MFQPSKAQSAARTAVEKLAIPRKPGSGEVGAGAPGELRQVATLLAALRAMGTERVLDEVLAVVLDAAIETTGAERGFIHLAVLERRNQSSERAFNAVADTGHESSRSRFGTSR